jgi:hypothetical protein
MDDEILTIYCLCDDLLIAIGHQDHAQCQMSSAEVMLVAIVAALHFGGNFAKARRWLHTKERIPVMLGKSRFSRRLHRVSHHFIILFEILAETWKATNDGQLYLVDTFPIPVCDNIRIKRCRIYPQGNGHHGYKASKRCYFYGLKLHLVVTEHGHPVEFMLSPGGMGDVTGLYGFDFDLPDGATIIGDAAYNVYWLEDVMEEAGLKLMPVRKKNSKRPHESWEQGLQRLCRQQVETAGSMIDRTLPKSIHATDAKGFELKVVLFVLGFSIDRMLR